jgi:hypothetical protein
LNFQPLKGRQDLNQGASKIFFGKRRISGRWPLNGVGRYFVYYFMAFLCVSQQGEFKNTKKNVLGKINVKNFWPKKLRKKTLFFLSSFPIEFILIAFLAVSLHEEPTNTQKIFSKIRPENLKKSQKK